MTREHEKSWAGRPVRTSRTARGMRSHAWRSVISRDASPARIYSHAAGDALGHRGGGGGGYRAEQNGRACEANLSRGVPLAARYAADIVNRSGKWSKRLAEPCQRNRITSTGRPCLSESPSQWRRDFNAFNEISSINRQWGRISVRHIELNLIRNFYINLQN